MDKTIDGHHQKKVDAFTHKIRSRLAGVLNMHNAMKLLSVPCIWKQIAQLSKEQLGDDQKYFVDMQTALSVINDQKVQLNVVIKVLFECQIYMGLAGESLEDSLLRLIALHLDM